MDYTITQQILLGVIGWMVIGTVIAIHFIINHIHNGEEDTELWASIVSRLSLTWPHHLCIMFGLWFISWWIRKK